MQNRSKLFFSVSLILFSVSLSAPPVCRACLKNCYPKPNVTTVNTNGTDVDDFLIELEEVSARFKRSTSDVEFKACGRFQIEMLLIPLSIAMIPLVLSALILCTCCCGPKDSRGKLPEDFLSNFPMSKKKRLSSEEIELEFRDGYIQRKDSSKTKFSTVVSYIEARRESIWSLRSGTSVASECATQPALAPVEEKKAETNLYRDAAPKTEEHGAEPYLYRETAPGTVTELPLKDDGKPETPVLPALDRLKKVASTESMKKLRFSDTVSVISVESLSKR